MSVVVCVFSATAPRLSHVSTFWVRNDIEMCGRDLVGGGTWMGVHRTTGNLAALTNFRTKYFLTPWTKTSRGLLIETFMKVWLC